MSLVKLSVDSITSIMCGGKMYNLCESEDGQLYIEAESSDLLAVTISDCGDDGVSVEGTWVNIKIT
jgi:hypothetical protein